MKKNIFYTLSAIILSVSLLQAQEHPEASPYSFTHFIEVPAPTVLMPSRDFTQDIAAAEAFEKQGNYPRFAKAFELNLALNNSGVWSEFPNGDRVWRLNLKSAGALLTSLFFDNFFLPEGSTLHVYTPDHKHVSGSYTYADNQGNELFSTEFLQGEEQTVEYFEPASAKGQGKLRISTLAHQYRMLPMADPCEVNVICSEGANWQDEKRGIVRIYVKEGADFGFCTGSLINNTALNCRRYILTAFHCGVNASAGDLTQWKFFFNYEATLCTGQTDTHGTLNNVFTGCVKKADSNDDGGSTGSDFLLLEMTTMVHPTWWANVYWNGWNKATTAPASGSICIHHPNGDNKKISKTTGTGTSISWGGPVSGTHWRVNWGGTANGWGVTEGGSSGSPLFNSSSQIIGTLTGGGSFCNNSQHPNGQNQPDSYGKLSYHWASNGTTNNYKLQPWLDPINSGVSSLNGGYNPCNGIEAGIRESSADKYLMTIYPNPSNGSFTVAIELQTRENIEVSVYDFVGREIQHKKVESTTGGSYKMDLTDQPDGVYFVHFTTGTATVTKKIILQR